MTDDIEIELIKSRLYAKMRGLQTERASTRLSPGDYVRECVAIMFDVSAEAVAEAIARLKGDGADPSPSPRRHAQPTAPPSEGASERQGATSDEDATLHRDAGAKLIGTLRAGSRAYLAPSGDWFLEVHPDHPPRMHFADGRPMAEFGNVSDTKEQS